MSNADFDSARARANIWIIGQAGHGKTTLTAAIKRCLSANGSAQTWQCVEIDDAPVCPEHAKGAILVVSAAEGPMPQTRDHLRLARQAGVPRIVVFLNKIDAADGDLLELVEMELRLLLTSCGFDGERATFVRGSATLALAGDASDLGEPSIQRLIDAVGKGESKSGGWIDYLRRIFTR